MTSLEEHTLIHKIFDQGWERDQKVQGRGLEEEEESEVLDCLWATILHTCEKTRAPIAAAIPNFRSQDRASIDILWKPNSLEERTKSSEGKAKKKSSSFSHMQGLGFLQ